MKAPYGVVFCGVPGQFSVWTVAPGGRLLDRETVELLGQMAVRSGASDYRTFPLEQPSLDEAARLAPTAMENIWVSSGENLAQLLEHVRAHGGVPPPAGSPGSRSSPLDAREAL
ncbi:MAG TPA: hypothetical protein VFB34_03635 [Chloroflexota bacterium]|nr:hypothetical protein [Chloroflexota bacterium]